MEPRDLSLLMTLDALLQEANVTRAARRLGLSTPATSHALSRIRDRLGDPILVRAGRRMVLTPRAEQLRPQVRSLVEDAGRVLTEATPLVPARLERTFTIHTTDHVLLVLGPEVDRVLRREAPGVTLRFLPSTLDDAIPLRDGAADMAICIPGHFPQEFRVQRLFTDRFTCVARAGNPRVGKRLSLADYCALDHVEVSPLGYPGHVDALLAERSMSRRVRRVVPYFGAAFLMVADCDDILTVSTRAASVLAPRLGLRTVQPPLGLASYGLNLVWHPRMEHEPAHRWLRGVLLRAARASIPDPDAQDAHACAPVTRSRRTRRSR